MHATDGKTLNARGGKKKKKKQHWVCGGRFVHPEIFNATMERCQGYIQRQHQDLFLSFFSF